ncbi:outer membrane lipoprotein carrier protein LolA [Bordetella genomosp. 8]|nr:outer membrane lipoprotein carrier protein LolA [Bordetella genomosp. 8]
MMRRALRWGRRLAAAVLLASAAAPAWAFDLTALQAQLREAPVVRGQFVQQKFLRSLPQPLTSTGLFTLSATDGLLWELRAPLHQDLLLTPEAVFRRDDGGKWQALPQAVGAGRETRMFLTVLSGDTQSLRDNFDMALSGSAGDWQLVMTPKSALLKQIFTDIQISGGKLVQRIELRETQGDKTVMEMKNTRADTKLNDDERRDFNP